MGKVIGFLHIVLIFLFASCEKGNSCFDAHGNPSEEKRILESGFHSIEVHDFVDIYIEHGNSNEILIEGGKNLIPKVKTEVSDSLLIIRHDVGCKWSRNYDQRYSVHVSLEQFKRLKYYGSGNIYSVDTLYSDTTIIDSWNGTGSMHLTVKNNKIILGINSGTVDMHVDGYTNQLFVWQQGIGFIHADQLHAPYGWIDHGGTGHCYLSDSFQTLDIFQYGIGNIYYGGNPKLNILRNDGLGKILKK